MRNQALFWLILGILSAGLGYGCEGDKIIAPNNDVVSEIYQSNDYLEGEPIKDVLEIETDIYQDIPNINCIDNDGDGYGINCALGLDCDDNNPTVHQTIKCNYDGNSCGNYSLCVKECVVPPKEICDGKDNDCDGEIDEGCELNCWDKTFGGSNDDFVSSIQQTTDGGYIAVGMTCEDEINCDAWIFKLDAKGKLEWNKTFGGSDDDFAFSIQQTTDGGYIATGITRSKGAGKNDAWVLKLDAKGKLEWDKTFGGSDNDIVYSIQQTTDGGYIAAGWTYSKGAGNDDAWVLKLDAKGKLEWEKIFLKSGYNGMYSIRQTTDGGYIAAGYTNPKGMGNYDAWVLKLDSNGNLVWDKTFGGSEWDKVYSIQQTTDGGYVAAGVTCKDKINCDAWIFKLDLDGNLEWDNTFGGNNYDSAYSIQQTKEGGYIAAGWTYSKSVGESDAWILKLDPKGKLEWDTTLGGSYYDEAYSIQQTTDGGYIVAGETYSKGAGKSDAWIFKLDSNGNLECK